MYKKKITFFGRFFFFLGFRRNNFRGFFPAFQAFQCLNIPSIITEANQVMYNICLSC